MTIMEEVSRDAAKQRLKLLDEFAAAFIKRVGTEQAEHFQLVEEYDERSIQWFFRPHPSLDWNSVEHYEPDDDRIVTALQDGIQYPARCTHGTWEYIVPKGENLGNFFPFNPSHWREQFPGPQNLPEPERPTTLKA